MISLINGNATPPTVQERALELLGLYGLSDREARIFLYLSREGPSGAGDVAKAVQLRRMEAYRLLKRLSDRGIVASTAGKPIKYQAETLEGMLALLMNEQMQYLKRLEKARTELTGLWRSLPRAPRVNIEQRFRIIQGREQIYNSVAKMMETASTQLDFILTKNDLVQLHVLGFGEKVIDAVDRGVKVRMITNIDRMTVEATEGIIGRVLLRHSQETALGRLALADGAQTLVSLVLDNSQGMRNERDIAIWTDSKDYADLMSNLYQVSFSSSVSAEERIRLVVGEKQYEERMRAILDVMRATLPQYSWRVSTPGAVKGVSGETHNFAAILADGKGKLVAVDVVFGEGEAAVRDRIVSSIMKKLDTEATTLVVISSPSSDEHVRKLANLMGVKIVDGGDAVNAVSKLRDLIEESA